MIRSEVQAVIAQALHARNCGCEFWNDGYHTNDNIGVAAAVLAALDAAGVTLHTKADDNDDLTW